MILACPGWNIELPRPLTARQASHYSVDEEYLNSDYENVFFGRGSMTEAPTLPFFVFCLFFTCTCTHAVPALEPINT
jgi:hypothetical protein